jgi:hypothetical protein
MNLWAFVIVMQCLFYEVGIEFLNIIRMNVMFACTKVRKNRPILCAPRLVSTAYALDNIHTRN